MVDDLLLSPVLKDVLCKPTSRWILSGDRCIGLAHELGCVVQTPEEAGYISDYQPPVKGYDEQH
jgi:hypothetical protein